MRGIRRTSGRLELRGLPCSLGEVVNISAGGVVVDGRPPTAPRVPLELGEGGDRIAVRAEAAWTVRLRRGRARTGYRFIDPPPDLLPRLLGVRLPESRQRML